MRFEYETENTCSIMISFDLDEDVVSNIEFTGGCNGNLQAVSRLVDGMTVGQIEEKLGGIKCGRRPTSCADQLTRAVRLAYAEHKDNTEATV